MAISKKKDYARKALLVGAGAAAIAGGIAAAIALSDEKNRKKVKQAADKLKTKADDIFEELKKLAAIAKKDLAEKK